LTDIERKAYEIEEKLLNEHRPVFEKLVDEFISTMEEKYKFDDSDFSKLYCAILYVLETSIKINHGVLILVLDEFLKDSKK
jgi:hypothetical protein